jgi:hypothetical protein
MNTKIDDLIHEIRSLKNMIRNPKESLEQQLDKQIMLFNVRNQLILQLEEFDLERRITEVTLSANKSFPCVYIEHAMGMDYGDDLKEHSDFEMQYQAYINIDKNFNQSHYNDFLNQLFLTFSQADRDKEIIHDVPIKPGVKYDRHPLPEAPPHEDLFSSLKKSVLNHISLLYAILKNAYSKQNTNDQINFEMDVVHGFEDAYYFSNMNDYKAIVSGDVKINIQNKDPDYNGGHDDRLKYLLVRDSKERIERLNDNSGYITIEITINGESYQHLGDRLQKKPFKTVHYMRIRTYHEKMLQIVTSYAPPGSKRMYDQRFINKALVGSQEFTFAELDIMIYLYDQLKQKVPGLPLPEYTQVAGLPETRDEYMGFDYMSEDNMAYGRLWIDKHEVQMYILYDKPCNMSMRNSLAIRLLKKARERYPFHIKNNKVSYINKLFVSRFDNNQDAYVTYPEGLDLPDNYFASLTLDVFERSLKVNTLQPQERDDYLTVYQEMKPWLNICTRFHQLRLLIQTFTNDAMNIISEGYLNNHMTFLRQINQNLPLILMDVQTGVIHHPLIGYYKWENLIEHYKKKCDFFYLSPFIAAVCGENEKGLFRAYLKRFPTAQGIWSKKWSKQLDIPSDNLNNDSRLFHNAFERLMNCKMITKLRTTEEPAGDLRFWYRDFAHNAVIDFLKIEDIQDENGDYMDFHEEIVAYALIKHTFTNDSVSWEEIAPYACSIVNTFIYKNPYMSLSFFMYCLLQLSKDITAAMRPLNKKLLEVFADEDQMNDILYNMFIKIGIDSVLGGMRELKFIAPEFDNFEDTIDKYRKKYNVLTQRIPVKPERLIEYDRYVFMRNTLDYNEWTTDKRKIKRPNVLNRPPMSKKCATREQDVDVPVVTRNLCCFLTVKEEAVVFAYTKDKLRVRAKEFRKITWKNEKKQPGNVLNGNHKFEEQEFKDLGISNTQQWAKNAQYIHDMVIERFKSSETKNATDEVLEELRPISNFLFDYYKKNPEYTKWHITLLINMLFKFFVYGFTKGPENTFRSNINFKTKSEEAILKEIKQEVDLFLKIIQGKMWFSRECNEFSNNVNWVFNTSPQVRLCKHACYKAWSVIDTLYRDILKEHNVPVSGLTLEHSFWFKKIPTITIFLNPHKSEKEFDKFLNDLAAFMKEQVNNVLLPGELRNVVSATSEHMEYYIQQAVSKFGERLFNDNQGVPDYVKFQKRYKPEFMKSATNYNVAYTQAHM